MARAPQAASAGRLLRALPVALTAGDCGDSDPGGTVLQAASASKSDEVRAMVTVRGIHFRVRTRRQV